MSSSQPSEKTLNETVKISEVIEKQNELEDEAAEVLPFDITKCSKPAGHIRQSVYSCLTCNPIKPEQDHLRAGVCSSCSVSCHTDHDLVELFVRRNFACDCGTERCNPSQCLLINHPIDPVNQPNSDNPSTSTGTSNRYDKNFDGQFCICERGKTYDPETETEDMYQCLACEDWRHASCLGPHPDPDDWDDLICADCVQNNPTIKSIMLKHAGGSRSGMIICKDSGTDGPDRITCYGILPTNTDSKEELPPNRANTQACLLQDSAEATSPITAGKLEEKSNQGSEVRSHMGSSSNGPIHTDHELTESQEVFPEDQPKRPSTSVGHLHEDNKYVEPKSAASNKRGSSSINPSEKELACGKKPRLDVVSSDPPIDSQVTECRAPFKNSSESILNTVDPEFSNVFLAAGWRTRWCPCPDCRQVLSGLSWLTEEEEEVWEPGGDTDSLKSIHELGLEALKKLPRDQLVSGLNAYNKLKEHILEFLKPFESKDLLVTEQDIRQFFNEIKAKIHNQTW